MNPTGGMSGDIMAGRKALRKVKAARQRPFFVRVSRASVMGLIIPVAPVMILGIWSLFSQGPVFWAGVTLLCIGTFMFFDGLTWVPKIGKTVIRMDESQLEVRGVCMTWDQIVAVELHQRYRRRPAYSDYLVLTLADESTFRIDEGPYTDNIAGIHRQLTSRVLTT